jgi:hypothetical protein
MTPLRPGIDLLQEDERFATKELAPYYRDVMDHLIRFTELADNVRDVLTSLMELRASQVANRLNVIMKRLSAWAGIILVPTLIAGIYGMNFRHLPELDWLLGYPLALGLMALAAEGYPLDKVTASMIHWALATQMPDGSWLGNGVNRPPIEFSTASHTAIAVRGLTLYPIPGRKPQIDRALEKAQDWLLTAEAPSAEDRAMRLMGLVWPKGSDSAVKAAIQEVPRRQTATGGWSQLPPLDPDAYATGLSLFALHEAGIPVTDDVYRKGVSFLLTTQYPDGSWLVRTRAFPVQPYFESGFPFGRHQWISAAGTAWAARAIALTLPDGNPSAVRK